VDGTLDAARAAEVKAHLPSCARCSARVRAAEALLSVLAAEPAVKAPAGFADRVMDAIYSQQVESQPTAARTSTNPRVLSPMYRRLGLSFVLTAAVLSASLFVPRASYPFLLGSGGKGAELSEGGALTVQNVIHGADNAVRGILGEQIIGGIKR
jgi:anti-sigma factor RsiW